MMFWELGQYINSVVLDDKQAACGKKVLTELAAKLTKKYGRSFTERNLYRMTLFAERFSDTKILPPLAAKLSWSHIIELLPLKTDEERMFYTNDAAVRGYSVKELRPDYPKNLRTARNRQHQFNGKIESSVQCFQRSLSA